jgi:hypothetical protein
MPRPSGAVHLVYDSAAGEAPTEKEAAPLGKAIEQYERYDHLLNMLSDELGTVDREYSQHRGRDPAWNARIAELEAQLDVDGLAQAFAQALELSRKLKGES